MSSFTTDISLVRKGDTYCALAEVHTPVGTVRLLGQASVKTVQALYGLLPQAAEQFAAQAATTGALAKASKVTAGVEKDAAAARLAARLRAREPAACRAALGLWQASKAGHPAARDACARITSAHARARTSGAYQIFGPTSATRDIFGAAGAMESPMPIKNAERLYARMKAQDPKAWAAFHQVAAQARAGNPRAQTVGRVLREVHKHSGRLPITASVSGATIDAGEVSNLLALIQRARWSTPGSRLALPKSVPPPAKSLPPMKSAAPSPTTTTQGKLASQVMLSPTGSIVQSAQNDALLGALLATMKSSPSLTLSASPAIRAYLAARGISASQLS